MSVTSLLGLDGAIQKALAQVPGLEDHAVQQIQAALTAELANVKELEDPALAVANRAIDAVNGIGDEVQKIRQLVEGIITGKVKFQAGFVPNETVSLDAPLPEVKS